MALRAFHANPSIGGFGGENSTPNLLRQNSHASSALNRDAHSAQHAGDAFCQIVKELVDNAVDAINSSLKNDDHNQPRDGKKRIQVEILPYANTNGNANDGSVADVSSPELLQVTVLDNGCGMENIQDCVNAFQSSKGGSQPNNAPLDAHTNTSGRYGIGLTLCMLHAQRLVPHSYTCITSTKKGWEHRARAFFVVDHEGDRVVCEKEEQIPKLGSFESSGTCVSLLIPFGTATSLNWSRLVAYFERFKLCPNLPFGLEILAPTLERTPIFIRPKPLEPSLASSTETSTSNRRNTVSNPVERGPSEENNWKEILSDDSASESSEKRSESKCSDIDAIPRDLAAEASSRRAEIVEVGKSYWPDRKIVLKNVAASIQKIRLSGQNNKVFSTEDLHMEVDMVVCPISAIANPPDEFMFDDRTNQTSDPDRLPVSAEDKPATLELVRMVNDVPLLDGAEAHSCGLVHGLDNKTVWGSFGLDIRRKNVNQAEAGTFPHGKCRWTPTYELQDHSQVSSYIQKDSNHKQLLSLVDDESGASEDDDDDIQDWNSQDSQARKRKRRLKDQDDSLLPAGLRLHEVLVVVRIRAAPSSLPLPSLSKGRLPLNHAPINAALHRGLNDCLRSLQLTNPSLLLSRRYLQSVVRDIRYIPKLATEIALSVCQSRNPTMRQRGKKILQLSSRLHAKKRDQEEESETSSCDSDKNEQKLEISALGTAIQQMLRFKLEEKAKTVHASKKRMKKEVAAAKVQRKDEVDNFEEIGCGEQSSCASESDSEHSHQVSSNKLQESQEILSATASWSEVGKSSPSPSKRPSNDENLSMDASPVPIREVEFHSAQGAAPVYESDNSSEEEWI